MESKQNKNIRALFTSDSQDWYTPVSIVKEIEERFGFKFDYDPCGNINSPTSKYIGDFNDINNGGEDGLKIYWGESKGNIFINPPFGREIGKWVAKAYNTSRSRWDEKIVMLIPARTDTSYWFDYIFGKADVFFKKGRIKFADATGELVNAAPFPSAIIVFDNSKRNKIITTWEEVESD